MNVGSLISELEQCDKEFRVLAGHKVCEGEPYPDAIRTQICDQSHTVFIKTSGGFPSRELVCRNNSAKPIHIDEIRKVLSLLCNTATRHPITYRDCLDAVCLILELTEGHEIISDADTQPQTT